MIKICTMRVNMSESRDENVTNFECFRVAYDGIVRGAREGKVFIINYSYRPPPPPPHLLISKVINK